MKDNRIEQNLSKGIIHLNDRKVTVPQTDFLSILPIQPITTPPNSSLSAASAQTEDLLPSSQKNESPSAQTEKPVPLISNSQMNDILISNSQTNDVLISPSQTNDVLISPSQKNHNTPMKTIMAPRMKTIMVKCKSTKVILPGQDLLQNVDIPNDTIVAIEPWEQNKNCDWPTAQLCTVKNGEVLIKNYSKEAVILGKDVHLYKVRPTVEEVDDNESEENSYYSFPEPSLKTMAITTTFVNEIKFGEHITEDSKKLLNNAHNTYAAVFNKDLTNGYNDFYGKHRCRLNWASQERPPASNVRVPNYNHDLKGLQQDLMNELTNQNVLLIPKEHNIKIQSVCPSFLQRKQRAKDKAQHLLTKDDVPLLINFGPVNDKIKPIPSHVTNTDDIIIALGRWKEIIIFDMYNGYFQIKMSDDSIPWMGIQNPFGGNRAICRSGQGLLGQAEEFDEVLAKFLKEELRGGICAKIVDDIYIGGESQIVATHNYIKILSKLHNAEDRTK